MKDGSLHLNSGFASTDEEFMTLWARKPTSSEVGGIALPPF